LSLIITPAVYFYMSRNRPGTDQELSPSQG
jgi:hypothetical protein